jgi:hypothetical protein
MIAIHGLRPQGMLCLGAGFSREEAKEIVLEAGRAFQSERIVSVDELSARILGVPSERKLDRVTAEEALRDLITDSRVATHFPELRSLSRRSSGLQRLERALERGRMAFAHDEEKRVLEERMGERDPVSFELSAFSQVWETYLQAMDLWDVPRLLKCATEKLSEDGVRVLTRLGLKELEHWSLLERSELEACEAAFWEAIEAQIPVRRTPHQKTLKPTPWIWRRYHTWDDAAEALARELCQVPPSEREGHVVLVEDQPEKRRSLLRAFELHGIELKDPRDPTHARRSEGLKSALLPLELEMSGYERETVVRWIEKEHPTRASEWVHEIYSRGVRQGLGAYRGGKLESLYAELVRLHEHWGVRRTSEQWAKELQGSALERYAKAWAESERALGRVPKPRRAGYCLEKLRRRIELSPPPPLALKPRAGFTLHRLGQARSSESSAPEPAVWIFGLSADFLEPEPESDLWFTGRARERLAGEFQVRARSVVRRERQRALESWLWSARSVQVMDALYDAAGAELESVAPLLNSLAQGACPAQPEELGADARFLRSISSDLPVPPAQVLLPEPQALGIDRLEATELDQWSRCGFKGLLAKRWRLNDLREPEIELWPDIRGTLLHAAVHQVLLAKREGREISSAQALELAFELAPPRGLLGGARVRAQVLRTLRRVLDEFLIQEQKHQEFAQTQIEYLDRELRLESVFEGVRVVGTPDRVDLHPEGRIITDYKSSAQLPQGSEMAQGYALQLPFYAVALREKTGQEVIGAQFVSLNRAASRARGIVFTRWNGAKTPGAAFKLIRTSRSLIAEEPEEFWSRMKQTIAQSTRRWASGDFSVKPHREDVDCVNCRAEDLCGVRRR